LLAAAPSPAPVDAVVAPPFTALQAVAAVLGASSSYGLAAQNLFWEDQGAYTGEISAPMLKDLGCRYAIIGHSERRRLFGETDEMIDKKVQAALRHGLRPIVCVGETLSEREAGSTHTVITRQLRQGLASIDRAGAAAVTVAYEPVWAIGTGRAATPAQAEEAHATLRQTFGERWPESAETMRILYGGSVTPDNAAGFLAAPGVDGALVGGACLDSGSFARILSLARETVQIRTE
jgi:triosephosphate isomerase